MPPHTLDNSELIWIQKHRRWNQAFFEANMFVNQRIQKKNYESNISRNVKNNVHHSKYSSYNGEMLNNNANSNYTKGGSVISNTNDIYNKSTGFNSNVNK